MRWRGSGVRDLGDRLTKERYNACVASTPHDSLTMMKKGGGVWSHNS